MPAPSPFDAVTPVAQNPVILTVTIAGAAVAAILLFLNRKNFEHTVYQWTRSGPLALAASILAPILLLAIPTAIAVANYFGF